MTRIVVVGDLLLDRDVRGEATRLCPDAPVPVLDEHDTVERAGGAGLAAVLARRGGAEVTLVAAVAPDEGGDTLRRLLAEEGVELIDLGAGGSTPQKVRVRAGGQSLLRIDRGEGAVPGPVGHDVALALGAADAVLVSDYGRGVCAHPPLRRLLGEARGRRPVVWDPHPRGDRPVPGTNVVTPNRAECGALDPGAPAPASLSPVVAAARRLRSRWEVGAVAVTLGDEGALLVTGDGAPLVVPVEQRIPAADPCGAGDAFATALAIALGEGSNLSTAVEVAVQRAAAFVAAGGAAQLAREPAEPVLVATGGCFDVLHAGHVATLRRARALGDRLVVLLNSDASVRRLKGPGRPVQPQDDRAEVLRSLACVDEVVLFDEDSPVAALRRLRPEVFVKGGDYSAAQLPEAAVMAEWGGTVVTVPYMAGRSTTGILGRAGGGVRNGATHVD